MNNEQQVDSCSFDSKTKRKQIREKLRQEQVEGVFAKLRCLQSLQNEDRNLPQEVQSSFLIMNESEAYDAICQYLQNENAFFQLKPIQLYAKITPSFCPQFASRVLVLIMSSLKLLTDVSFLSLALLIANKCQKSFITNYTNLQKCICSFVVEKRGQFDQLQRLTQLLCVILAKEEHKRDVLQAIHENWTSLRELGVLNGRYLKLAALCCYYGRCFVSEADIIYYVDVQRMSQKDELVKGANYKIDLLCRIVCAFLRQSKTLHLGGKFLNWMSLLSNLNLVSCKDKEEMLEVVLRMFQHLQMFEKQKLACQIAANAEFMSLLTQLLAHSHSLLRQMSMQIICCTISSASDHLFKQLNMNFGVTSKIILSLSPGLQNRQNMAILKSVTFILAKYSCLLTEQDLSILEQKLVVLSNTKALQNEVYRLLTSLDFQCF